MKITGIIAEYNPFHNGHEYQFRQIRKNSPDTYLIIVMSGNHVQRGEPSVYDKYTRTKAALLAGADLVLELPAAFAVSSAEDFAAAGVALLDQLGCVDELCFGSECGSIEPLTGIAALLAQEPEAYQLSLREGLKQGLTFPQARNQAIKSSNPQSEEQAASPDMERDTVLQSPNNILGIEYLKALIRRNSSIKPVTLARKGQGYHDQDLQHGFASASGIRSDLMNGAGPHLSEAAVNQVPAFAVPLYEAAVPIFPDDYSILLNYTLLRLVQEQQQLKDFADVSPELEARIRNCLPDFTSFTGRIGQLKTRQYTYTRISRSLLHILLGIKTSDIAAYRRLDYTPYARILGFRKASAPLLSHLKANTGIPLITKIADAGRQLPAAAAEMLSQDLHCAHIYQMVQQQKSGVIPRNEFTQSVIII